MKYATINNGVIELRQSYEMMQGGIPLTDEQYEGIASGPMTIIDGQVVANPNWPPPPPVPDFGTINSKALVRRRANELQQSGREIDALLLLKTIGE